MVTPTASLSHHRTKRPSVVVDLQKLRRISCGLGQFSLHLAKGIIDHCGGRIDPVFLLPAGGERHFGNCRFETIRVRPWKKAAMQNWVRPFARPFFGRPHYELWHMTNQMSRYEPLDHRVPLLLTIHDLTFLHESPNEPRTVRTDRKLADLQRRIDRSIAITVDSEFVAADVRRELDVKDRPIHVIPLGLASAPPASASRPGFLADGRPFLLSIGTALAHKNFHSLFDLLEEFTDHRLVIAGNFATRYGEFLQGQVVQKRLQDRVLMPGEVSDPDRQWLYERCEAFLFPSLSEGFGLPVLEAMAAGRPVFVSRRTGLPEITGEHGFYFDSFEPKAMAMAVREGLARFEADTGFAARARSHAEAFTWAETTRRYADLYEQLVAG